MHPPPPSPPPPSPNLCPPSTTNILSEEECATQQDQTTVKLLLGRCCLLLLGRSPLLGRVAPRRAQYSFTDHLYPRFERAGASASSRAMALAIATARARTATRRATLAAPSPSRRRRPRRRKRATCCTSSSTTFATRAGTMGRTTCRRRIWTRSQPRASPSRAPIAKHHSARPRAHPSLPAAAPSTRKSLTPSGRRFARTASSADPRCTLPPSARAAALSHTHTGEDVHFIRL